MLESESPQSALPYPGRLALQQRVLPAYRAPFLDALAAACAGGLSVFAGQPLPEEQIPPGAELHTARLVTARNWHFLNPQSPLYRCYQAGIIRWLENWQPDALVVEANPRYLSTLPAVRWMHARRRPVLGWGLGAPPVSGRFANWRLNARRKFLLTLDGLVSYSQQGASEYRSLGFPAGRIFVAANSVMPAPPHPLPERTPVFIGRARVLFVGRLQERKRIDHLLRACASLPDGLQPEVIIVGEGPARLGLEQLAGEIYPTAQFMGARFGPELAAEFIAADLFVLPGTGGLAVQQAMAYGLPVIMAQGDGTQDDLVRPGNGWQIPADDLPALQHTLMLALEDSARLRTMGAESYRIVREEINIDQMVNVFVSALRSL